MYYAWYNNKGSFIQEILGLYARIKILCKMAAVTGCYENFIY